MSGRCLLDLLCPRKRKSPAVRVPCWNHEGMEFNEIQQDTRCHHRANRAPLLLIAFGLSVLLGLSSQPAHALGTITKSDFPAKTVVKSSMNGKGHWSSSRGRFATLGGKPGDCRSDKQMLSFDRAKSRFFYGREKGMPRSIWSNAEIVVLRYPDTKSARRAVKRNASYPRRCPKVTEWVCNDCDGIWTTWRTRTLAAKVGRQSVVWRFREIGNFKSNGYTVVSRRGSTIVRVTVGRTRDVSARNGWVYPKLIKKREALRVARKALNRAT